MAKIHDIIQFYKECYAYDFRSISIRNFFGRTSQQIMVINDISLLSDSNHQQLVSAIKGRKVMQELVLNAKEKGLYVGALFLQGKMKQLGKMVRVAPPLFIYEARMEENFGKFRISLESESPIINPYFLEVIKAHAPGVSINYEEFAAGFPSGLLGIAEIVQIETWLKKCVPALDVSDISPWYENGSKLENARFVYKQNKENSGLRVIGGICAAMVKKQEGSLGVINELNQLSQNNVRHSTLEELFGLRKPIGKGPLTDGKISVPFSISPKQEQVFHNASQERFSLVIGPPGTGKSYTIAALTAQLVANGRSVLVASKNNQAGKVVVNKLENEGGLRGLVIKAGRMSYRHHLSNKIKDILSGLRTADAPKHDDIIKIRRELITLESEINLLKQRLIKREIEEKKWGEFFANERDNFFQRFKSKWIHYRHSNAEKIWHIKADIDLKTRKKNRLLKSIIKKDFQVKTLAALQKHRSDLLTFTDSLATQKATDFNRFIQKTNFNNVLKAIPAWVINTSDAHQTVPLQQEIFDILIIDEATQCDIASCLPLIYRAKHTVIIGDPKQLRNISFLSTKRENLLLEKYQLSQLRYRDYSILDLFRDKLTSQSQVTFLNEHYRSLPDIISFSNKKFYNESMHLMTETPITRLHKHIFIKHTNGIKGKKGENAKEANAILEKIREIIKHEQPLEKKLSSKIGVLSPFRAQVTLLKSEVKKSFTLDQITKHDLLIGTPYHFQGEERDVMLLSMVIDNNAEAGSFTYLNRPDVFNVSITRARDLQIVYTSVEVSSLKQDLLLYEYLSHIEAPRLPKSNGEDLSEIDRFTDEVYNTIDNWGVDRIYRSYAMSGVVIDLVIVNQGKTFCVDLIGFPGPYKRMFASDEVEMLDRMGHKVFYLPYSEWNLNREDSIDSLYAFLFPAKG